MSRTTRVLAVIGIGTVLGLGATWLTVIRGSMGGAIQSGTWRTSLDAGSKESGMYQRASIAVHGLLALNRSETIYYGTTTDSAGLPLDGRCTYRLQGRDPKARWWSVTAYAPDDYLIPNAANRYSVSKNSVTRDPDGSFSVMLAHENGGENWIPVNPGPFSLSIRLYNPDKSVVDDPARVALPTITREVC